MWKCKVCHEDIYEQFRKTSHSRMLRNAIVDPGAIEADDFSEVTFEKKDIYFVIGSHWLQKYLSLIGGQFYVLPRFWNLPKERWEPYTIFNWDREPYPLYCNGCHVVGFDIETNSYREESVWCESCHGPGEEHVKSGGDPQRIVNPANLNKVRRDMICEACHTDGRAKKDTKYRFPAGFTAGENLTDYYTESFAPKPDSRGWYWGTVDYKERHRMFVFWQTRFYSPEKACTACNFRVEVAEDDKRMLTRVEYCGTCHRDIHLKYSEHAFHTVEQAECDDCHVPTVVDGGLRYSIHDHKFDFSRPPMPCIECHETDMAGRETPESHDFNIDEVKIKENLSIQQACARCHKDRDEAWILEQMEHVRKSGFIGFQAGSGSL